MSDDANTQIEGWLRSLDHVRRAALSSAKETAIKTVETLSRSGKARLSDGLIFLGATDKRGIVVRLPDWLDPKSTPRLPSPIHPAAVWQVLLEQLDSGDGFMAFALLQAKLGTDGLAAVKGTVEGIGQAGEVPVITALCSVYRGSTYGTMGVLHLPIASLIVAT